jgi:hypothetical protein
VERRQEASEPPAGSSRPRREGRGIRLPTYAQEFTNTRERAKQHGSTAQGRPGPRSSIAIAYLTIHEQVEEPAISILEPANFREAMASPQRDKWNAAMEAEIEAHRRNETWRLVEPPPGSKVLPGRWVYRLKRDASGDIMKFKARWVVKGYEQRYGIDYNETYASVVKAMSYRAIYVICAALNYEIWQMDFITAFLNSLMDSIVYVEQPHGFVIGNAACLLLRALYGLKQAPRVWYETLYGFLSTVGYTRTHADHSVFTHANGTIVAVYVDDLQIFGPSMKDIHILKNQLSNRFSMSDLGPASYYLGIRITRDRKRRTIRLSQEAHIAKVLQTFGMADCQPISTPMEPGLDLRPELTSTASIESIRQYQSAVGSLMYIMLSTRPDIAFAISVLSRFAANPNESHWKALKRCLRYLKATKDLHIVYGPFESDEDSINFDGYSDSDWGGDKDSRKSTSGYVYTLGGGAISWTSKRQQTIALSSCEAEYMAMTLAAKEALWLKRFLGEIGCTGQDLDTVTIHADNQGAIALAKNPEHHARTKHIDVQYHFIREHIEANRIKLSYLSTHDMPADGLTKPLSRQKFQQFVNMLGMRSGGL